MHRPRSMAVRNGHGPAAADAAPEQRNPSWAVLVVVCLAQFMVMLDGTVVNVALPRSTGGCISRRATCSGW